MQKFQQQVEALGLYASFADEDELRKKLSRWLEKIATDYESFTAFYQHMYNGEVNIIGNTLDGFDVGNLGLSYTFNTKNNISYIADFRINNIYNTYYENVALRPMPNRNFKTLKVVHLIKVFIALQIKKNSQKY